MFGDTKRHLLSQRSSHIDQWATGRTLGELMLSALQTDTWNVTPHLINSHMQLVILT